MPGVRLIAAAEAALQQRRVRFGYRTARGAPSERLLDTYGLVYRSGHWYLVGLDLERKEIRAFRLSRVTNGPEATGEGSAPPEGFRAGDHVQAGPWGTGEPEERAKVAFSPEVGWWAISGVPGADLLEAREDGWVEALVPAGPGDDLASWVLSFGPDAEAMEPDRLRAQVVARLEAARAG